MGTFIFLSAVLIIASILMILVVLVQNSKGGGLASNFSSSNQYMGVRKTADFLEKFTWTLSIVILAVCLFSFIAIPKGNSESKADTEIRESMNKAQPVQNFKTNAAPSSTAPAAPADSAKK